jgi:hypothetical protein
MDRVADMSRAVSACFQQDQTSNLLSELLMRHSLLQWYAHQELSGIPRAPDTRVNDRPKLALTAPVRPCAARAGRLPVVQP